MRVPPALRLVILAGAIAAALAWVARATEPRIAVNRDRAERAALAELVGDPAFAHGDFALPTGDDVELCVAGRAPVRLLRAHGRGYGGDIGLVIAVGVDHRLRGARVTTHRETPGIGDVIEASRSDWIHRFDGLPADPDQPPWTDAQSPVDAVAGATITTRAVAETVRHALRAAPEVEPCRR